MRLSEDYSFFEKAHIFPFQSVLSVIFCLTILMKTHSTFCMLQRFYFWLCL
ncbi:hypothetical protein HOLleu_21439 [Holothuria leucospilota]|uniref:Uncharacterized protein n=1 Tax=Holothuria leucospilota TaxID=206669 RepID=A0A9Q1BXN8_HOLLE|nr:hypothetical protein HOLleu_21439 [Holothuria leucospilota]